MVWGPCPVNSPIHHTGNMQGGDMQPEGFVVVAVEEGEGKGEGG